MKKRFGATGPVRKWLWGMLIGTMSFGLTGCNEQMVKYEENQIKLEQMVQANSEQMAAVAARIEQNQQNMRSGIEQLQSGNEKVAINMAGVGEKQARLEKAVQNNSQQLSGKVVVIEQNQQNMQAGIEIVQESTKKVSADLVGIRNGQIKLHETMQEANQQLAGTVAAIEQKQQNLQSAISGVQDSIDNVAVGIDAFEQNLSKLQALFESNRNDVRGMVDVSSQEQQIFEEAMRKNLQVLADSLSTIKQSQTNLQKQISDVQSSAKVVNDSVKADIEQLKAELSRAGAEPKVEIEPAVADIEDSSGE